MNTTTKQRKEIWGITNRGNGKKGYWTRIGTAFENADGSYNQLFDYFPTNPNTTIQFRDPKPREDSEATED